MCVVPFVTVDTIHIRVAVNSTAQAARTTGIYSGDTHISPHVDSVTRYHHSQAPHCFRLTHPEIGLASGFIPSQMKDIRCVLSERARSYSGMCSVRRRMAGDNGPVTAIRLTALRCPVITRHMTAAVCINQRLRRLEINHTWRCLFRWTMVTTYRRAALITERTRMPWHSSQWHESLVSFHRIVLIRRN